MVEIDPREMSWEDIVCERNARRTTTLRVLQAAVTAMDSCGELWRWRGQQWMDHHRALIDEEAKTRKGLVKHLKAIGRSDEDYPSTKRLESAILASPSVIKLRDQQRKAAQAANTKWATKNDADQFLSELTKTVNRWRSE